MKIAVVGTGYVGLVTGTCFAESGNHVQCVDIDVAKISKMRRGEVPIFEPGLEDILKRNIAEGRLSFTADLAEGIREAGVIFLSLPTPPTNEGSADLSAILSVADKLGELLDHYVVVVNKSTVPVGTAERVRERIRQHAKHPVDVVSNPEFLREGFAVSDFMKPDRIVIGTSSEEAVRVMSELYQPFATDPGQVLIMDERSAEMTKYAANSFLATKISFMNEIANLCERVGADVDQVRIGIGSDNRIGKRFLYPGIGFGGSCFPKDVRALYKTAEEFNYDFKILTAVSGVNHSQKQLIDQKIKAYFGKSLHGKKFALWGLAFKPDTDDIREAPSLIIIDSLVQAGAEIVTYDPEATENVKKLYTDNSRVSFGDDMYEVLSGADALIIATEWNEFRTPEYDKMRHMLKTPTVFDGRNIYDIATMQREGFYYNSVGRRVVNRESN